ncbi:MAG TPA: heavy metal-binding domain-containing protein [Lamprocystis sp. (in: g-proteobacteria)]|nr:heavy metal-binding domain-containing protein [Lamprocystis sp. (in: g-proteobacteria)]
MKLPNHSRLRYLLTPIPLLLLALLGVAALLRLGGPAGSVSPTAGDGSGQGPLPLLAERPAEVTYVCPMHPEVVRTEPGKCPICGMDLVVKTVGPPESAMMGDSVSHVCPMHPQVVSTEPGKCPICGMDLVVKSADLPVTEMATGHQHAGHGREESVAVTVSDAVVNQLGVRTTAVRRGSLARDIEGPGVFLRNTARAVRPVAPNLDPVAADPGTAGSTLMVLGQVFEHEAPLVRPGQSARVRFPSLGAREWMGTVTSLESQVSQTTHTLPIRVSVEHEGASIPGGMTAIITVAVDPVADVLLVPREAVIETGQGARVVVALEGGRFQPRDVQAEDLGEDEMVIRSGLREGEWVVVSAQFLLDSEANLQSGLMRLRGAKAPNGAAPMGTMQ